MGDLIFLLIPIIIGGVVAKINSDAVSSNLSQFSKWINIQKKIVDTKIGFTHTVLLLPILNGCESIIILIKKINNQEMQVGVYIALLIYIFLLITFLLGVAVYNFEYSVGIILLTLLILWILYKRNVFAKRLTVDIKNIKPLPSAEVIDLNKEEDLLQPDEPKEPDLDQFGLPKKR